MMTMTPEEKLFYRINYLRKKRDDQEELYNETRTELFKCEAEMAELRDKKVKAMTA